MFDRFRIRLKLRGVRGSRAASILVWAAVVSVFALFLVWEEASVDRLLVRLEHESDRHHRLETEVSSLSLEATRLASLALVEPRAVRDLALGRPQAEQIVNLEFEGTPPAAADLALRPFVSEANADAPRRERLP